MTAVLMVGNPIDGVRIIGPFDSAEEACEEGDRNHSKDTWWGYELEAPESDETGEEGT